VPLAPQKKAQEVSSKDTKDFFSYLRTFSRELYQLDTKPLFDISFQFPWSELSEGLSKIFGVEIVITPEAVEWKTEQEKVQGLSEPLKPLSFSVPKVPGHVVLYLSKHDFETLFEKTLELSPSLVVQQDPEFVEKFTSFVILELLAALTSLDSLRALSPKLIAFTETSQPGYLCQDISIKIGDSSSLARLLIPEAFLKGWRELRVPKKEDKGLSENLPTYVCVEAGRTFLSEKEMKTIKPGDLLLLDYPFYIPGSDKSRVMLTHRGKPLFRGKIKDGQLKVLEMPFQHEVFTPLGGHNMEEIDPPVQEKDPVKKEGEAPSLDIDLEHNPFEGEDDEEASPKAPQKAPKENVKKEPDVEQPVKSQKTTMVVNEPINIEELPLTVVVQIAEVELPLKDITAMQPGNLIELNVRPEDGVSLLVNNRVFAQGQLIMIGEKVGVQIKDIGFEKKK
jgi:flagellar motor switch protein FliN